MKRRLTERQYSFIRISLNVVKYIAISIVVAALYYLVISFIFSTDREKQLAAENDYLQKELDAMEQKAAMVEGAVKNLEIRDREIYNNIFHTDPPKSVADIIDSDTTHVPEYIYSLSEEELIWNTNSHVGRLDGEVARINRELKAINDRCANEDFNPTAFPSIIPIKNFTTAQTGASTGMKMHPFYKTIRQHSGIDLIAPIGTEVIATADGVVTKIERQNKGYGHTITIDHGNGLKTFYAHLGDIYVRNNQRVKQGTTIARVGNSGTIFAAALHYEVIRGDRSMEPINYFFADISPVIYQEMMMIAANTGQSMD